MDKESLIKLQKVDCNCNDCRYMVRNFERMKGWDWMHVGQEKASHRVNYGDCAKLDKPVTFLPNTCQIETQGCFSHRRENLTK